jgi:cytochrome c oxidase assembly protein subunit 15
MSSPLAEVAAYNLSPLTSLLAIGALLGLGPTLWVWWRNRGNTVSRRRQALRVFTLFLTFDLVIFGAFTRLTDSGLGCPDWPGCYGNNSPLGAGAHIDAAQSVLPDGPVTHAKAWIEMLHRYLATAVGALIVWLTVLAWRDWWHQRQSASPPGDGLPAKPWLASVTLIWVCLQGAFGALTVTMKLFPAIVTLHLLGALVLLVLLCIPVVQHRSGAVEPPALSPPLRSLIHVCWVLLMLQVALGGWVSSNYAVLACSDFPTCQGRWWPEMDFRQGFELWRGLGLTSHGEHIGFAALTAIHYVHRLMAYLVLLLLMLLAWQLNRQPCWRLPSRWLAGLLGLQLATGLSNVVLGWPLLAALLHTGGAAALVLVLTWVAADMGWPVSMKQTPAKSATRLGVTV